MSLEGLECLGQDHEVVVETGAEGEVAQLKLPEIGITFAEGEIQAVVVVTVQHNQELDLWLA